MSDFKVAVNEKGFAKLVEEADQEAVNHPSHYGGDTVYETIKVCEAWGLDKNAYLFNAVKYISRAGKKSSDTLEDLKKAQFYLNREIKNLNAMPPNFDDEWDEL